MDIVLCTTPIRPVPTDYPPFGSMALIQSLRAAGYDPYFYDIDGLRPSFEEVLRFFRERKPGLIAISAVVSTAYAYTQQLCLALRKSLPDTPIVLGGNMAASAELLHRRCGVDVCVSGEGEKIIVNLVRHIEREGGRINKRTLRDVKGLTFLDESGEMAFTGFEIPLEPQEFLDPDFSILEQYSRIGNFVWDPLQRADFARDPRSYQPHRKGQKLSTVLSSKGCVARCTFCHRWDKGYRHYPVDAIVRRMEYLRDRYNVGFFAFGDENFGSDRQKLEELIKRIKPMDVLFAVAGVRCRTVDLDLLKRLKDAGCVALYYGMETGSPGILKVMEKNIELHHNLQAALWSHEAGLYTIYQLVLGMPGETDRTVSETEDFIKRVTEMLPEPPHKRLSINYIQALPGTPVYEYAREKNFIPKTLDGEEDYLLRVSDIDANDDSKFLNFTEEPIFKVKSWRHRILFEAELNWRRKRNWETEEKALPSGEAVRERDYYKEGGYFNLKKVLHSDFFYRYLFFLRPFYLAGYVVAKDLVRLPFKTFLRYCAEYLRAFFRRRPGLSDYRSLRRIMRETAPEPLTGTEAAMLPLRAGR